MKLTRNVLNMLMTLSLLLVMNYRFTGNAFHELLGLAIGILFVCHNQLNRRWYKTIGKGKMPLLRPLSAIVNFLLLVAMALAVLTGVFISQAVFPGLSSSRNLWIHELHIFSSYLGFILCAIHLGFHWNAIYERVCRWLGIDSRGLRCRLVSRLASLLVIGYGVYASYSQQIGSRLLFQHVFGGMSVPSLVGFSLDHAAVMGLYAAITHYLTQLLRRDNIVD